MKNSNDTSWDFFFFVFCYQRTFIQEHCVHSSTYVAANVSIVPAARVFTVQGALSLPHTTVPFDPPLSRTLYSYTSHTFPCPPTSHSTRMQGWHTLRPMYNTESHPFLHLIGQAPLMPVCLHAPAVHAPYSHGSVSAPLLTRVTLALPLHGVSRLWDRGHRISR